ncbi:MAG: hypothetical protein ACYTDW_13130 [Planctomycetota bacterium]|jgi:hypothetical protein
MAGGVLQHYTWHNDTSWSSGLKPTTGDAALVEAEVGDAQSVIDTGGTAEAVDLALLQTHPFFNGRFGSSSTPIKSAATLLQVFGGGAFYFECHKDGASAFNVDRAEIAAATPRTVVQLGSDTAPDNGEWVDIFHHRGALLLKSNIVFNASARVVVGSIDNPNDAALEIATGAPTLPTLDVGAGVVTPKNVVTALNINGGVVYKQTTKATTVDLRAGTLFYDHEAIGGDATRITVHRGAVLHLWRNAVPKLISTLQLLPGAIIVASKHTQLHDFTTLVDQGARWIQSTAEARAIGTTPLARAA